MPATHVKHKRELALARKVCREWQAIDPVEVQRWRLKQRGLAEAHEWTGGWSQNKEMLAMEDAPSFVVYGMIRGLQKIGWPAQAAQHWDRQQEGAKFVPSDLWKAVVDELLPEAKTTRKERVNRTFGGVSFPSS